MEKSGLAEKIINSQPSPNEQTMARAFWEIIIKDSKLERPGKRERISKEEKEFLKIKDKINPKSFGKFVIALSANGLEYSNSTYSRLWNKSYSG